MSHLYLDSGDLSLYDEVGTMINLLGVTTNPTILLKEKQVDFINPVTFIRSFLVHEPDLEKQIHYQVVGNSYMDIKNFYKTYLKHDEFKMRMFCKVIGNTAGLKLIMDIKKDGFSVTATGMYYAFQAIMAAESGADYVVLYVNRMESEGISAWDEINTLRQYIDSRQISTKILAASFKNISQVIRAFSSGAHVCTVSPDLLLKVSDHAFLERDMQKFTDDWLSYIK